MLNQIVLVGRLVKDPVLKETEQGKKRSFITLAIPRSFKNAEGSYDTDFIDCILWDGIAKNTAEYCKKGDVIGVKGRLQSRKYEMDNTTKFVIEVIAEKVTFLTSHKEADE
ncbi:MAG TPA: single-stranded DNA-binding protein [Candidatus Faecenecus gallistercoris]|jgi:single-strand DNA-binding protein|uniref:Single-stranded DNA-binding protein n=1 Tax=Candidatus Faecenecus gallistercoris TaxID=2840793 RepID=A0A9D0YZY9_9FIRM|nr:single-stranded DNA-binding protein [Bacillota bacterium]MDD7102529.1 single-stranded DNA-binding protein [Bacillota bacterium]MDY4050776.1 single-stranded DNA-binding protein [Candidatus Faecenecus gallistercoris]CDE07746.1 single-stranded DNA-binding protein [Bacillus sp. CAG:988]HIQ64516.1 single-stranded DNA-binding protein [Candidatus Faecenecus gallistercoris]